MADATISLRTRLQSKSLVAVALRDREMNARYLEVQTRAGRPMPDAGRAFVQFLTDAIRAGR